MVRAYGALCYFCREPITAADELAGNPDRWPMWFPHPVAMTAAYCHASCFMKKLGGILVEDMPDTHTKHVLDKLSECRVRIRKLEEQLEERGNG